MLTLRGLLLCFVMCSAGAAEAPSTGAAPIAVTAVTAAQLALYARPLDDSKSGEIAKASVPVPLPILDTDEEERFFKVELNHEYVWVKAKQVFVSRGVRVSCLAKTTAKETGSAVRGANEGCKK